MSSDKKCGELRSLRGSDLHPEESGVSVFRAVGIVVHQPDRLSLESMALAAGISGRECCDCFGEEEFAGLDCSLLDGWHGGG